MFCMTILDPTLCRDPYNGDDLIATSFINLSDISDTGSGKDGMHALRKFCKFGFSVFVRASSWRTFKKSWVNVLESSLHVRNLPREV